MRRIGWIAVGLVLGIMISTWYHMAMEEGNAPPSARGAVVEKARGAQPPDSAPVTAVETTPFTPDMDRLREELPGNLAIPPRNRDERWMRKEAKKARNELFGRINANVASEEEVHSYYDEQALLTRDSIAMLEWILKEYEDEMGARDLARHHFLLDQFKKRLVAIPHREARALKRISAKEQG